MATSRRSLGWAYNTALRADFIRFVELPIFLCPALSRPIHYAQKSFQSQFCKSGYAQQELPRLFHSDVHSLPQETSNNSIQNLASLPRQCAGCGAFSQTSDNGEPGFYSLGRKSVRAFLAPGTDSKNVKRVTEREIIEASLRNLPDEAFKALAFSVPRPTGECLIL
jgi:hypothetical protein